MPKLDGVAATSLIRKFDQGTPIISMTSNSKPNEIMTYYNHGNVLLNTLRGSKTKKLIPGFVRHERYPAKAIHKRRVARHARGTSSSHSETHHHHPSLTDSLLRAKKQKHLMHLKVIQQMSRIPRPMSAKPDTNYDQALTASSSPTLPTSPDLGWVFNLGGGGGEGDEGRINPLAAMGLSDEGYQAMVQNLISAESFMDMGGGGGGELKRAFEEDGMDGVEDGRGGKRSRFEVIE